MALRWLAPSSRIAFSFWPKLADVKVKEWRLDTSPKQLRGYLLQGSGHGANHGPVLEVRDTSFVTDEEPHPLSSSAPVASQQAVLTGEVVVCNTAEEFKSFDKNAAMRSIAERHWRALQDVSRGRSAYSGVSSASAAAPPSFFLLIFADLKEQKHVYWFGFPAAVWLVPVMDGEVRADELVSLKPLEIDALETSDARASSSASSRGGSLANAISVRREGGETCSLLEWARSSSEDAGGAAGEEPVFVIADGVSSAAAQQQQQGSSDEPSAGWFVRSQLHYIVAALQARQSAKGRGTAGAGAGAGADADAVPFTLCIERPAGPSNSSSSSVALIKKRFEVDLSAGTPWCPLQSGLLPPAIPLLPAPSSPSSSTSFSSPSGATAAFPAHIEGGAVLVEAPTATSSSTSDGDSIISSSSIIPSPMAASGFFHAAPAAAATSSSSASSTPPLRLVDAPVPPEKPSALLPAGGGVGIVDTRGFTAIGWELSQKGLLAPRIANLRSAMDPSELSESAAQLNLDLMRWRQLPQLQLSSISSLRCLLLGAGTLGCHLARDLLAWGVRKITFVDAGRVSFSNPVRQPLFEFADAAAEGGAGKLKAQAAADALRRIHPKVEASGRCLRIPMPGHPVPAAGGAAEEVKELEALIESHDVVFLLTDTRESRWLPTLIASAKGKLAVTVALGFDSFLSMRHGVRSASEAATTTTTTGRLGCYFCSDVVSPTDSTQNRTLDQQCTVTRPGVAPLSSALAAELLMALLHHPRRFDAPADGPLPMTSPTPSPLGLVPHQLRGFLSHTHLMLATIPAFPQCPACSDAVVDEYRASGYAFLEAVFNDTSGAGGTGGTAGGGGILDRVTGLQKLKEETEAKLQKAAEGARAKKAAGGAGEGGKGDEEYADLLEEWVLGNE